jgi:TRAP-type C4-dicarboxylate transport system permease small subunit
MKRIGRMLAATEAALGHVAGLLLIALLVLMNVEVVARYVFNTSTLIADEYGGYLMAWITMLGAVHILRADRHLTMTAFVDRLSPRARNRAGIVSALIGLGICVVLLYATSVLVGNSARFGSRSIQPSATPLVWPQLIMPLGYALLCLAYVEEIARRLRGLPPRRDDPEIDVSLS